MHPSTSRGYSSNKAKAPPVVMDDCTIPVYGVAFGSSKGSSSAVGTSTNVMTASMLNWEKTKEELPLPKAKEVVKSKVVKVADDSFFIDEEEMFVASLCNSMVEEEFFVVL